MGWAKRKTKGFCEIRLFRPPGDPKIPKFRTKTEIFSFFAVQVAFLHGSLPFLVWKLLWGKQRGRQKDLAKFAFLDPQRTPKCRNLVPKIEISVLSQLRVHLFMDHHHRPVCKPPPHVNHYPMQTTTGNFQGPRLTLVFFLLTFPAIQLRYVRNTQLAWLVLNMLLDCLYRTRLL